VLLVYPVARRLIPAPVDHRTPRQRAPELVRASLGRGSADRRRALDVLGRALAEETHARDALDLAWSKPVPEPDRVLELVQAVEGQE
jgi:hypothetical protein